MRDEYEGFSPVTGVGAGIGCDEIKLWPMEEYDGIGG